jgi:hypothetical protein
MQVHLSEQMQQFVQQHVDIGLYTDTAEVIRDALRQLMREQPPPCPPAILPAPSPWALPKLNKARQSLGTRQCAAK